MSVPLVTAAAGCGGTGRELARFGDLADLDAVLLGPIGLPGAPVPRVTLTPSPSGLVHTRAPVLPVDQVVEDLLPWFRARSLRLVCAIRGSTIGTVADTLQRLRRSLDFGVVAGIEVDLTEERQETRPAIGGLGSSDAATAWSTDPQACLKVMSAAREQLPRDLLLLAKIGGECPDPVAAARAAVGGGARALVLSGGVPALESGRWLAGPATAPIMLGLVTRVREAMAAARVPEVPLVAVGGVHDVTTALAARTAGAAGVQVGSGILTDPQLLWRVHGALASGSAESDPPTSQTPTSENPAPTTDGGVHHAR